MRNTVFYILGAIGVTIATSTLSNKAEESLDLPNQSALPRLLYSVLIGGVIYLVASEYKRAFEPDSIKELTNSMKP